MQHKMGRICTARWAGDAPQDGRVLHCTVRWAGDALQDGRLMQCEIEGLNAWDERIREDA